MLLTRWWLTKDKTISMTVCHVVKITSSNIDIQIEKIILKSKKMFELCFKLL